MAMAFLLLAIALFSASLRDLLTGRAARESLFGIGYQRVIALVMLGLAAWKRHVAVGAEVVAVGDGGDDDVPRRHLVRVDVDGAGAERVAVVVVGGPGGGVDYRGGGAERATGELGRGGGAEIVGALLGRR